MLSMFEKWIFCFFIFLALSSYGYARVTHPTSHTIIYTQADQTAQRLLAYTAFTAGYGKFQNASQGSGETPVGRIAIGTLWQLNKNVLLGGEIGIQSGNRMQLSNNVAAAFGYSSSLPLFLTVKLPIDMLAVLKYHFESPFFVQIKPGVVYLRTMTDSIDIPSQSKLLPELQVGAGFDLTCNTRIVLSYQQFFGQTPTLTNINSATGTANLNHVPSWQAGIISFEIDM